MQSRNPAARSPEAAHKIITDNINVVYHLPRAYKAIDSVLTGELRRTLLAILNFTKAHEPIIYSQRYVYVIPGSVLTYKIRRRTTAGVSNRYLNFLCCTGLLDKIRQSDQAMLDINQDFLDKNPGIQNPMNVISIYRYTPQRLAKINASCDRLAAAGITPGNISHDHLCAAVLGDLARKVYYSNTKAVYERRSMAFANLVEIIDSLITDHGYTTKQQIRTAMQITDRELDKLWTIFRQQFREKYYYGAPNKEDTQKYGLSSRKWIIKIKI